ncbi:MAG TPA: fibronectin type III domain-containing protein [Solirubrobacteraceae bacterium]|nr:fibronectin type III domain-containing protein [Solirubrobacteraceae bacterium]
MSLPRRLRPLLALPIALAFAGSARAAVLLGPVIDGPSPDILSVAGVAISHYSTGGVAYLKNIGGVAHAFVSVVNGGFGAPLQIDGGLPGASSDLQIAAGDSGRLAAVFVNGGSLYAAVKPSASGSFLAPRLIAPAAESPSLGMASDGTAYAAFVTGGAGDHQVQVARLDMTGDAFASSFPQSLNANVSDDAGATPATAPRIYVASDGGALVAWGELESDGYTHLVVRRVESGGPDPNWQDLTLPALDGEPGGSAGEPALATTDVLDFGWVAFQQTFYENGTPIPRVLVRQMLGESFGLPIAIDNLAFPTTDGAATPSVGLDMNGDGLTLAQTTQSHQVVAGIIKGPTHIQAAALLSGTALVQGAGDAIAPQPALALGYDDSGAVAWLQSSTPTGPVAVTARALASGAFTTQGTMSNAQYGSVDPAAGLAGGADRHGAAVFAFVEQGPQGRTLLLGVSVNPPSAFEVIARHAYTSAHPTLHWQPSSSDYGIAEYKVVIDGATVGTTTRTSFVPSGRIPAGTHRLTVIAVDRFGQSTSSDTVPLRIQLHPRRPARRTVKR